MQGKMIILTTKLQNLATRFWWYRKGMGIIPGSDLRA